MRAELSRRIAPPTPQAGQTISAAKVNDPTLGQRSNMPDFKSLLHNSNEEISQQRHAAENGDLSQAKDQGELLELLNDRTKQRRQPKNAMDKDDFLKLFVTQLQNQDPLKPKDNAEMASQLAQFNGLEQMLNVNKTLTQMSSDQNQSRSVDLVNYIGKEVTVDKAPLNHKSGQASELKYHLDIPVTKGRIEVRDASGAVIHQEGVDSLQPGVQVFKWHGKDKDGADKPDGIYHVTLKGINDKGIENSIPLRSRHLVKGVELRAENPTLQTDVGNLGITEVTSVKDASTRNPQQISPTQTSDSPQNLSGKPITKSEGHAYQTP